MPQHKDPRLDAKGTKVHPTVDATPQRGREVISWHGIPQTIPEVGERTSQAEG